VIEVKLLENRWAVSYRLPLDRFGLALPPESLWAENFHGYDGQLYAGLAVANGALFEQDGLPLVRLPLRDATGLTLDLWFAELPLVRARSVDRYQLCADLAHTCQQLRTRSALAWPGDVVVPKLRVSRRQPAVELVAANAAWLCHVVEEVGIDLKRLTAVRPADTDPSAGLVSAERPVAGPAAASSQAALADVTLAEAVRPDDQVDSGLTSSEARAAADLAGTPVAIGAHHPVACWVHLPGSQVIANLVVSLAEAWPQADRLGR